MRATRIGTLLLGLGLGVGCAAGGALLLGLQPSRLPAALLDVVAYKLAFVAALGLIVAGAVVRRLQVRRTVDELPAPPELVAAESAREGGPRHLTPDGVPVREARTPEQR